MVYTVVICLSLTENGNVAIFMSVLMTFSGTNIAGEERKNQLWESLELG